MIVLNIKNWNENRVVQLEKTEPWDENRVILNLETLEWKRSSKERCKNVEFCSQVQAYTQCVPRPERLFTCAIITESYVVGMSKEKLFDMWRNYEFSNIHATFS